MRTFELSGIIDMVSSFGTRGGVPSSSGGLAESSRARASIRRPPQRLHRPARTCLPPLPARRETIMKTAGIPELTIIHPVVLSGWQWAFHWGVLEMGSRNKGLGTGGLVIEASQSGPRNRGLSQQMESLVMKPLIPKTLTAVSVLALALAVGGCGFLDSDDDDDMMDGDMAMTPTTPPADDDDDDDMMVDDDDGMMVDDDDDMMVDDDDDMMVDDDDDMMVDDDDDMMVDGLTPAEMAARAMLIAGAIGPGVDPADSSEDGGIQMPFTSDGMMFAPETDGAAYMMSDTSPAMIADWTGSMHTRMTTADDAGTMDENESVMDTVVSYTNEMARTDEEYSDFFPATGSDIQPGVDTADADGVLTIDENEVSDNHARFIGNFGITGPYQTIPAPTDDNTTPDVDEGEVSVEGSFYGVPGTFTCDTGCSRTSDEDGNLSELGGDWTFTPTGMVADLMVQGVIRDMEYLTLGYWLREEYNDDGEPTYAFGAFANGTHDDYATSDVEGTAEYAGPATGLYMIKDFGSDGMPMPRTGGQFTADAKLMAHFGGTAVSADLTNSISGTITDFRDDKGDEIDSTWTVMLNQVDADDNDILDSNITGGTGDFSGVTAAMGSGGAGSAGEWSGTFHGVNDPDTTETDAPYAATGTFDAHFLNGHARGAFAATMTEE